MEKVRKLKLWLPIAGYQELFFIRNKITTGEKQKQTSYICQFRSSPPQQTGDTGRILSFGVAIMYFKKKRRIGFIKRYQLLVKS